LILSTRFDALTAANRILGARGLAWTVHLRSQATDRESAMTKASLNRYRKVLEDLARRLNVTSTTLESETLRATSGESAGGISNTPMHLADVGSEAFSQELNATLLENEEFLGQEVARALQRIDKGSFGLCEQCGDAIPTERLEVLPYARYCVPCTEKLQAGGGVNYNDGRPTGWGSTFEHPNSLAGQRRAGESSPSLAPKSRAGRDANDGHASGTPGGGSALGGLAGTNFGDGEPDGESLESAMGSGSFDVADESDLPAPNDAYSGPSGGAIGGSPANKRITGGRG
jgi:DnaK suppressor protein